MSEGMTAIAGGASAADAGQRHAALERVSDVASPLMPARLDDLLDRPVRTYAEGDPLAPLSHWLFFHPRIQQSTRGEDGHARRSDALTDLPRRMWAGSEVAFHNPIRAGALITRHSRTASTARKSGRSGPLGFVTIDHTITDDGGQTLVEDRQTLVYRPAGSVSSNGPRPVASVPEGAHAPSAERTFIPDPTLLFFYSALTYNGHRIHYDQDYAVRVENYPGLVVHGPLIATMLLGLAQEASNGADVASFRFRALGPLFVGRSIVLKAWPGEVDGTVEAWAFGPDGEPAFRSTTQVRRQGEPA